ncbi:MAG TPA: gamma-glutamyltransferase [Bryobacteraceae bacterium]|nr:gamma-glutamyltransferase [Bryobacteraceae bacterium]
MNRREGVEIVCENGAVAAGPVEAARAGAVALEKGGNAFDAAAAACLAAAVTEPQAVDIGGYVFAAVVLDGASGRTWSIDANTIAPAAATPDMFRTEPMRPGARGINEREYGCSVVGDANVYGPLAVGVPGFVAGVGTLWERWGGLEWAEIVAPAKDLVEEGLPYSRVIKDVEFKAEPIARYPSTAAFLMPGAPDHPLAADDLWRRPDLACTLGRLAETGWRDFYTGEIGRHIADFVTSQGGILTRADMAAFAPRITDPHQGTYRGVEVRTTIPPNGGFSVLEALAELEHEPVRPDTDPAYWDSLAKVLAPTWTKRLADSPLHGASPHGTMHVAAADKQGNLVSATISQGGLFGACLAVPGTGIVLGHGMCRFDPRPGLSNSPGPGKRPLTNVSPLLLRMPERDVAIGVRGGRRIVSVAVQLAQRIIDDGASVHRAAVSPRMHTLTGEPLEISDNFNPAIRESLEHRGYRLVVPDEVAGSAHGAELLRPSRQVRAGGNIWAAGI